MAGQFWSPGEDGGYLYSDELSETLRFSLQPLTKFRQLADARDGSQKAAHRGDEFSWNVYQKLQRQGRELAEREPIPETSFKTVKKTMTVTEAGQSVPYTGKLEILAKEDLVEIISQTLQHDARNYFDYASFIQMDQTPLRVVPTSGTATDSVTLSTNGIPAATNNIELGKDHIQVIGDIMRERNIPAFVDDSYVIVSRPSTIRPFRRDLETVYMHTSEGINHIFRGEIGKYEEFRVVEQTYVPAGGAYDSTTFDALQGTSDPWNNGKSSWAFFLGADTVTEAMVVPEEIRAKIPTDFGRSKAIAWYYLGGFGLVHDDADNARVIKWDSAA